MNATLHPIEIDAPESDDAESQAPAVAADEPDDDLLLDVKLPYRMLAGLIAAKLEGLPDLFRYLDGLASFSTECRMIDLNTKDTLAPYLRDNLPCFRWYKRPEKDPEKRPAEPPDAWANDVRLAAAKKKISLRHVVSTHDGPVLYLKDGRVCLASVPGFTETAPSQGVWVNPYSGSDGAALPHGELPQYSQQDAARAAQLLLDVVPDFQWRGDADRAGWVAMMLTICGNNLYDGPHPAFIVQAKHRGGGKSLLSRLAIGIATISDPLKVKTAMTLPDEDEQEKRLASLALKGQNLVFWDNVKRPIAGQPIESQITASVVSLRILGRSEMPSVVWRPVHVFTMNTARASHDMAERSINVQLDSTEGRRNESFDDVQAYVRQHQIELFRCLTIILAAWLQAKSRGVTVKCMPFGSFESWHDVVQSACVFAGLRDPKETQRELFRDRDATYIEAHETLWAWQQYLPSTWNGWDAKALKDALAKGDNHSAALDAALRCVVHPDDPNAGTAKALTCVNASSQKINAGIERLYDFSSTAPVEIDVGYRLTRRMPGRTPTFKVMQTPALQHLAKSHSASSAPDVVLDDGSDPPF
jgi:hypothetical protein